MTLVIPFSTKRRLVCTNGHEFWVTTSYTPLACPVAIPVPCCGSVQRKAD